MKNLIQRLQSVIRNISPLQRSLVIVLLIVIAISYLYFSNPAPEVTKSQFGGLTLNSQTIQGSEPVSQEYQAALTKADNQRIEEAKATGTSAVPTIVLPRPEQTPSILITEESENAVDKLPKPELPKVPIQLPTNSIIPKTRPVPKIHSARPDQKTTEQIIQLISRLQRNFPAASVYQFKQPRSDAPDHKIESTDQPEAVPTVKTGSTGPLIGTVYYGQLITQVNSDSPGPVLAQILQGPYQGARLIGNFELNRESATIQFNQMTTSQHNSIPINAIAVDTNYIGTSLVSNVDRHLIEKIGFGFIAGFAQGLGNVLPRLSKTTTETTAGDEKIITETISPRDVLYSAAGQAIADTGTLLFDEFGQRSRTIVVDSGTEIGVFFY